MPWTISRLLNGKLFHLMEEGTTNRHRSGGPKLPDHVFYLMLFLFQGPHSSTSLFYILHNCCIREKTETTAHSTARTWTSNGD